VQPSLAASLAPGPPFSTVLVEDDGLFRDLLRLGLDRHPLVNVVGSFADASAALAEVPGLDPRVAILDVDLGGEIDGVRLGLMLREKLPGLAIVLLTNQVMPHVLSYLPPDVVRGWSYLHKKTVENVEGLTRAIEGACMQLLVLDESSTAIRRPRESGSLAALTPRQLEVLELLVQGYTNAAIAERLVIETKSVERHISVIYERLGIDPTADEVHPRVHAVLRYLEDTISVDRPRAG